MRKPLYKVSHQAWYCQLPGIKRGRNAHEDKNTFLICGPKAATEEAAEKKYHKLMAAKPVACKTCNSAASFYSMTSRTRKAFN